MRLKKILRATLLSLKWELLPTLLLVIVVVVGFPATHTQDGGAEWSWQLTVFWVVFWAAIELHHWCRRKYKFLKTKRKLLEGED